MADTTLPLGGIFPSQAISEAKNGAQATSGDIKNLTDLTAQAGNAVPVEATNREVRNKDETKADNLSSNVDWNSAIGGAMRGFNKAPVAELKGEVASANDTYEQKQKELAGKLEGIETNRTAEARTPVLYNLEDEARNIEGRKANSAESLEAAKTGQTKATEGFNPTSQKEYAKTARGGVASTISAAIHDLSNIFSTGEKKYIGLENLEKTRDLALADKDKVTTEKREAAKTDANNYLERIKTIEDSGVDITKGNQLETSKKQSEGALAKETAAQDNINNNLRKTEDATALLGKSADARLQGTTDAAKLGATAEISENSADNAAARQINQTKTQSQLDNEKTMKEHFNALDMANNNANNAQDMALLQKTIGDNQALQQAAIDLIKLGKQQGIDLTAAQVNTLLQEYLTNEEQKFQREEREGTQEFQKEVQKTQQDFQKEFAEITGVEMPVKLQKKLNDILKNMTGKERQALAQGAQATSGITPFAAGVQNVKNIASIPGQVVGPALDAWGKIKK